MTWTALDIEHAPGTDDPGRARGARAGERYGPGFARDRFPWFATARFRDLSRSALAFAGFRTGLRFPPADRRFFGETVLARTSQARRA